MRSKEKLVNEHTILAVVAILALNMSFVAGSCLVSAESRDVAILAVRRLFMGRW